MGSKELPPGRQPLRPQRLRRTGRAAVLGGIALTRGRTRGATNSGQAIAGIVCGVLALVVAIVFAVRFGTFVARNTNFFTTFDNGSVRTRLVTAPSPDLVLEGLPRLIGLLSARLTPAQAQDLGLAITGDPAVLRRIQTLLAYSAACRRASRAAAHL